MIESQEVESENLLVPYVAAVLLKLREALGSNYLKLEAGNL
jgi:hypothetical protein